MFRHPPVPPSRDTASYARAWGLLLLLLLWSASARPAAAHTYVPMSETEMTCRAQVVVVGTLAAAGGDRNAPRKLKVERPLKGDRLKPGGSVNLPQGDWKSNRFPDPREIRVVAWLAEREGGGGGGGALYPINFGNAVQVATNTRVGAVERDLRVLAHPGRHLDAPEPEHVEALCHWVQDRWLQPAHPAEDVALRNIEAVDGVRRARVTQFLTAVAADHRSRHRAFAVRLLGAFGEPAAFDTLAAALSSPERDCTAAAADGLRRLGDRRAVPHLVRALGLLADDDVRTSEAVCKALAAFRDPASVPALIRRLERRQYGGVSEALAAIGDRRALPALLDDLWTDGYDPDAVLAFRDDPSVLAQARERKYDHPQAPYLLAKLGDPDARPLMLKLIRQCNSAGLVWAERTEDREALDRVVESMMRTGDVQFLLDGMRVLASTGHLERPGAVAAVARLLADPGYGLYAIPVLERRLRLAGPGDAATLPGQPIHPDRVQRVWAALLARADAFGLDPQTRRRARRAARPPQAEPPPPPADLTAILASDDPEVQVQAVQAYDRLGRDPTADQLRSLFGTRALDHYLYLVRDRRRCAHPQVLVELIRQDPWVSLRSLHEALRVVKPAGAAPRLRELLHENHIDVRREAAVTLAHLGDASGADVLLQELARFGRQKYSPGNNDAYDALKLLGRAPR